MPLPSLCQGRVVWFQVPDARGSVKRRPVIIITSDDDIDTTEELVGVVCSHTSVHVKPRPADYIEVAHAPSGMCRTKLRKPTVAVCRWAVRLPKSVVAHLAETDYGGVVPPRALEKIVEATVKYLNES